MQAVFQDLRYALRMFKRNWGFTLTALTVMALSICATVAIFSAVNAIILKPLPYQHPERLMIIWDSQPKALKTPTSPADFLDWQTQTTTLESLAATAVRASISPAPAIRNASRAP